MTTQEKLVFNEYGHLQGELPADCVQDCSHQGACDSDVEYWVRKLGWDELFETPAVRRLAERYLRDFGAWDDLQTADAETLAQRVLWTAACDQSESGEPWYGMCA